MSIRVTICNAEPEGSTSMDIVVRRRKVNPEDGAMTEVPGLDDQVVKPAHCIEVVTSADIPALIDEYHGQPLYITPKEQGSGSDQA